MYVCHCEVVSDHAVRTAIEAGAREIDDVAAMCGAGSACAGCHPTIAELLADAAAAIREPELLPATQSRRRHVPPRTGCRVRTDRDFALLADARSGVQAV